MALQYRRGLWHRCVDSNVKTNINVSGCPAIGEALHLGQARNGGRNKIAGIDCYSLHRLVLHSSPPSLPSPYCLRGNLSDRQGAVPLLKSSAGPVHFSSCHILGGFKAD